MSLVIYVVTLAHRKINVCPTVDPHIFYSSEADRQLVGGSKLRWTDSIDSNAELDTNLILFECFVSCEVQRLSWALV